MKTNIQNTKDEKDFATIKAFREIKEKIAKETKKVTFAGFKEYLKRNKLRVVK